MNHKQLSHLTKLNHNLNHYNQSLLAPEHSAATLLQNKVRIAAALIVAIIAFTILAPKEKCFIILLASLTLINCATEILKTFLFITGIRKNYKIEAQIHDSKHLPDNELPVYTLMIPVFKEGTILPELIQAIRNIDYPKSKLDIKLVVEADDDETLAALKKLPHKDILEIIKVPPSMPRTKPKALSYALHFAKGEYIGIYDAEDIPDPKQLRLAALKFKNCPQEIVALQAKLNFSNYNENVITRLFALEYSIWFEFILPGLESANMPIPLGGTSNHIIKTKLEEVGGWDPYNVTEDADLGIRLATYGYQTIMLDSITREESLTSFHAWIKQRSRWLKGHMQTYLVHMRKPVTLYKSLGFWSFLSVQLLIGLPPLIFILKPFLIGLSIVSLLKETQEPVFNYLFYVNLCMIFILPIMTALYTAIYKKWFCLCHYSILFPLYFILHSIASFRALWQLLVAPYFWEKTEHGVSKYR